MSFSILPEEIKIEIFNLLSISNRYNASLVWREMSYETWRSIPTVEELKRRLTDKFGRIAIQNLNDLETAGVLASAGYLEPLTDLHVLIRFIDVTNVPFNIVNSIAKVATSFLVLKKVTGLNLPMLKNLNCEELRLQDLPAPLHLNQDISVNGKVTLIKVSGDISEFLDNITCEDLQFHAMKLNNCDVWSLTKMLNRRVRNLTFFGELLDPSIIANYDGQGQCERMLFKDNPDIISKIKEHLSPLAYSKGWNIKQDGNMLCFGYARFEIQRATLQQ